MTNFGLKNCFLEVKTLSHHNSAPFWSWDFIFGHNVLHHQEYCLLGVSKNFNPCMADFGLKNCLLELKTLSRHNSAPFWSWDFMFGHNVLHHQEYCLLGMSKIFSPCMADFRIKNCLLELKTLSCHNSTPFWSWDFKFEDNVRRHCLGGRVEKN